MRVLALCTLCVLCALLVAGTAAAYTVTLKQGVGGYSGTTDTYINRESPTTNYGSVFYMHTYRYGDRIDRSGLIKFDLTGQLPQGMIITGATLSLWVYQTLDFDTNDYADIGPYQVRQYRDWVESQATWNVFKGTSYWATAGCENTSWDRKPNPDSTIRFTKNSPVGQYYHWDVTASVQAWYSGSEANNGWLIRIAANDGVGGEGISFYTKEASLSERPYLTIHYIPEPSSLLGVSASLLGLLAFRRRFRK